MLRNEKQGRWEMEDQVGRMNKQCRIHHIKIFSHSRDVPGSPVVKNPPSSAGERGFDPWSRKIPHAMEQLSPGTTTTEPMRHNYWARMLQLPKFMRLEPMLHNKRSHRNEKAVHTATKSSPRLLQLEKARAHQRRPNAAKI